MKFAAPHALRILALVSVMVVKHASAIAQAPVLNPTSGHYYAKIAGSISWTTAKTTAESLNYLGMSGHLATLTDSGEQQWVYTNLSASLDRYWLGGFQDHSSPNYSEPAGGWRWVTDEAWAFTAWHTGEPNNTGGAEDFLMFDHQQSVWNDNSNGSGDGFIVEYETGTAAYCTAGTTSSGCVPSISGTGTASASSGSGFTISVSSVESLKQGILFYGLDNTGFTPTLWALGSTSSLCVKHPTQRTHTQNSGGSFGQCNGYLSLDWNAFIATNAGALGNPFSAGQQVFAQGWFRDPPAPKTTNLSNALSFFVTP